MEYIDHDCSVLTGSCGKSPRNERTSLVGQVAVRYRPISKCVPLDALPEFEDRGKSLGPYVEVSTGSCTDEILG